MGGCLCVKHGMTMLQAQLFAALRPQKVEPRRKEIIIPKRNPSHNGRCVGFDLGS